MLSERSRQIRRDTITLSHANGGYHYGGCFSATEILIALFDSVLQHGEDQFILSKGHACWPYYVLLRELGLNPDLAGHPSRDPHNGVPCTTGSLGHGFPLAVGMALAKKAKGESGYVFVLMGDGECQEGTTWESLLIANNYRLDNLVVVVDWNGIQGSGRVDEVLPLDGFCRAAQSVGWDVAKIDGHNPDQIISACISRGLPRLVIAETVKGKGISFMENQPEWHAKWPSIDEHRTMLEELA